MRPRTALVAAAVTALLLSACGGSPVTSTSDQNLDVQESDSWSFFYQTMPDGYKMLCVRYDRGPSCDWVGYHIHLGDMPKAAPTEPPSS